MRINYTLGTLGCTGGVRTFYEITKRLVERGHTITVTAFEGLRYSTKYPWKAKLLKVPRWEEVLNMIIKKILKNIPLFVFNSQEILRKRMPECDINVAADLLSASAVYRSHKGLTFYHHQHDETLFYSDPYLKSIAEENYYTPFFRRITNSIWLKDRLKNKYNLDSFLILNAIANEIFYPRKIKKNSNKKRIVSFGKALDWKGFKDSLMAMKIVMRERKDVEWFVYGQKHNLPKDPGAPYNFVYFPSDDELAELYSSADVVICPSWYESFPAPPLEAMACGVPVVTTPYGTEDYAFNEENSLIVPPQNPQLMAEAISRILEDKKLVQKFKENGPNTAKQFTWDKTADQVESFFETILKNKKEEK